MRTQFACLTLITVLSIPSANAFDISTGEDLNRACKATEAFTECVTYLNVVYQTAKAIADIDRHRAHRIFGSCGPDQGIDTVPLSVSQRAAWLEYANEHPGQLRTLAMKHALLAFERKWPCKR